ncbi:FG-GAP and VCBS repeat-containing protein [Limnoglobus roseus]|uniref:VCBS repeat-containing protein n=1 Tax=Limnoglobus roseus TaxID=2598579 RepID=A0A5C1AC36_9BACT|nr:FG-GAP and VCBS repeat-containing protein [Limnoglobus roseus]QEL15757.1 VCBS repeat-containing protein [Limnoglobus roseus]
MPKPRKSAPLALQPLEDRTTPASAGLQALDIDPSRSATADVNGDGFNDFITVTKAGQVVTVNVVYANLEGVTATTSKVFESTYTGGARVAAGDLDGDGRAEIVVSADIGGSGRVVILKAIADPTVNTTPQGKFATFTQFETAASFFGIADANFRGGSSVAVADFNSDGKGDVAIGAGVGGGPRVAIYDGTTAVKSAPTRLVNDFFALPETSIFRGGVSIDAGDVNGDGKADLIVGAGPGGGQRTRVISGVDVMANKGSTATPLADFLLGGKDSGERLGEIVSFEPTITGTKYNGFSVFAIVNFPGYDHPIVSGGTYYLGKDLPKSPGVVPDLDDRVTVQ